MPAKGYEPLTRGRRLLIYHLQESCAIAKMIHHVTTTTDATLYQ